MPAQYRAEIVGSFLRPPDVLEAHEAYAQGRLALDRLRAVEDQAILNLLNVERQVGLDVMSDGEYRRGAWAGDFQESVDGYVPGAPPIVLSWHRDTESGPIPVAPSLGMSQAAGSVVIGEKLRRRRRLTEHEASFLQAHAQGAFKVTMPAPSYVVARGYKPGVTDRAYPSRAAVLKDAVAIIQAEIKALVAEGVPYIQLDNPHYPDYIPEDRRAQMRSIGIDPDQAIREDVEADNEALTGFDRSQVTLAMHLCRGNGGSAGWHTEGSYERIAEQVLGGIHVDRFLLEYDSQRAGGFEPLRFVPKGTTVVLGLVTTKSGEIESPELILRRIDEASRQVDVEHLAVSPQCGFASVIEGNPLTLDQQRRKLELVVEVARKVWG
ncbi:MAG: hypothetical protein EXR58_06290 [Chloroflexi bacterium]|nr:hypothetical protein [Chloroflexota bacterium]